MFILLGVLAGALVVWKLVPATRLGEGCKGGSDVATISRSADSDVPTISGQWVYQFDPKVTRFLERARIRHTGNHTYGKKNDAEPRHLHDPVADAVRRAGANAFFHAPSRTVGMDLSETVTTAAIVHPGPIRRSVKEAHFPSGRGQLVVQVAPGGAAEQGGMRVNDLLVRIGGQAVPEGEDGFLGLFAAVPTDGAVEVEVIRDNEPRTVRLVRRGRDKFLFWAAVAPILEVE